MSSDREKFQCLKRWKEVGDYIFEDKRDPIKICELLQAIIDDPLRNLRFSDSDDTDFIEELKTKTMIGKIKWRFAPSWNHLYYANRHVHQDIIDSMQKDKVWSFNEETNEQCTLYASDHKDVCEDHLRITSTINGKLVRTIYLNHKNKDFFGMIFEKAKGSSGKSIEAEKTELAG